MKKGSQPQSFSLDDTIVGRMQDIFLVLNIFENIVHVGYRCISLSPDITNNRLCPIILEIFNSVIISSILVNTILLGDHVQKTRCEFPSIHGRLAHQDIAPNNCIFKTAFRLEHYI